ncbi:dihydropteroate synthase [Alkalispirochaeta sphaeroplastigenens]|uniref:dihydropteroate synthase n=1 Tax=Alkalispirochaeta sphaeroplastigenens TaxID=1187066 RepID=A0A2S4JQK6_9SPIO|nr:dihydropteroate synthase [Alkalispirochaeta sphaeroplastigenens]POR01824.1 dihydropteroate synthase [Alkalispirochaeta sphaeroplastigenens]
MGIINVTHDSFFASSRVADGARAQAVAVDMVGQGADILDLGGESSRPGSHYVSAEEELRRLLPAIEAIRQELPHVPLSVDTRKAPVAERALDAGATMVNDISGFRDDPELAALVAERGVPVCLMHMRGTPRTMQENPRYDDLRGEMLREMEALARRALVAGVQPGQIILDPGIGFGKTFDHNWGILADLEILGELGYPLLVGLSRKSFLGEAGFDLESGEGVALNPEERLSATLAAQLWCTLQGVSILRVHDVKPAVETVRVLERILAAQR